MSALADRRRVFLAVGFLLVIGAGTAWWFGFRKVDTTKKTDSDPIAATASNSRGIGLMEQFKYERAEAEFTEAVRLAPDWLPARINLGISIYNQAGKVDDPVLPRAIELFTQLLKDEPKNPYGHFNLGIIYKYTSKNDLAFQHFKAVTEIDPNDDRSWLYMALSMPELDRSESPQALEYYKKANALNPALAPALYGLSLHALVGAEDKLKYQELFAQIKRANWEDESRTERYSEQGRYATCIGKGLVPPANIGPVPIFDQKPSFPVVGEVKWDNGTREKTTPFDNLLTAVRNRFGGVMVRLDYNRDGKPDLLLLSAAYRDGKLCDVLLRNDGDKFTDVSAQMGLQGASLACAVADYDNDSWPDLLLTGETGVRLLRNDNGKSFQDKSQEAGLDKLTGVYLSALWLDIDQDGDLDLVLGQYASTSEKATEQLTKATGGSGGVVMLQNIGVAPPSRLNETEQPLSTAFKSLKIPAFAVTGAVSGLIALDYDGDKDVDLVILQDGLASVVVLNDRIMRFHQLTPPPSDARNITSGLIFDANSDEQSDLLLLTTDKPHLLVSKKTLPDLELTNRFTSGATDSPSLISAQRCDLDNDGRSDVVGLSRDRKPVYLQGDGQGKLTSKLDAFGPVPQGKSNLLALAVCDMNADGNPDLVLWSREGVSVYVNQGNGNNSVTIQLSGKRDGSNAGSDQKSLRTNSQGIGTKINTLTGPLTTLVENTTLSSGPGQSLLPLEIGIGKATEADTVRLLWPDCVVQAELAAKAGKVTVIVEENRKGGSCPVLMTWDGEKWVFVTDFLGAGSLGESGPDGTCRLPRPEESVKIESHQLRPYLGQYQIRLAEPMDEITYLDHIRLDVIDHPSGTEIFPDERFAVAEPMPTQKLLAFNKRITPVSARDHQGQDVTKTLAERDGKRVTDFARRSWMGLAEEHYVELDFSEKLKELPSDKPIYLVAAGWTDYPYPEAIIAASQAGVEMLPPVLERLSPEGKWIKLGDIGFPAGLPKVMTVPVGDWLKTGTGSRFRIRTNLQIEWDQLYFAAAESAPVVTQLMPVTATFTNPGFVQEISPSGRPPQAYDPNRFEPVAVTKWKGQFTRTGSVTQLLSSIDDKFVILGPGHEVIAKFDATKLPPLPANWSRSFVLRTHGYCKDTASTTVTGGEVEPLPRRDMKSYPPKK